MSIYKVSGDTDFPDDEVICYYEKALKVVKENDPKALTTLHNQGQLLEIQKVLEENPNLDLDMYQSCHNPEHQETAYMLAQQFYYHKQPRPVINGEQRYEQLGVLHPYRNSNICKCLV